MPGVSDSEPGGADTALQDGADTTSDARTATEPGPPPPAPPSGEGHGDGVDGRGAVLPIRSRYIVSTGVYLGCHDTVRRRYMPEMMPA